MARRASKNSTKATQDESLVTEILEETETPVEEETISAASLEEMIQSEDLLEDEEDIEEVSVEGETKERRKRGKRQILFSCAANVILKNDDTGRNLKAGETALILEEVSVTMPAEGIDFDVARGRAEAIEIFESKYNVTPVCSPRPYYIRKGLAAQPRKRETVNVTVAKEAAFTAERGHAIHRFKDLDWHVIVNFTVKPDLVWVFYDSLVDPSLAPKDKTKFQKPTPKFLPAHALRDLQKNPSATA